MVQAETIALIHTKKHLLIHSAGYFLQQQPALCTVYLSSFFCCCFFSTVVTLSSLLMMMNFFVLRICVCLCLFLKKIRETKRNNLCGHLVFFFSTSVNVCGNSKQKLCIYLNGSYYCIADDVTNVDLR
jgi:hypothetical protein